MFYLVQNATPVVSKRERDELLIWRSQLSSQKSLSTLLQTTEKCHVRNLLFQSIRPLLCCPAKVFCEVEAGAFWCIIQISAGQDERDIKRFQDNQRMAFTIFIPIEVSQCHGQRKMTNTVQWNLNTLSQW